MFFQVQGILDTAFPNCKGSMQGLVASAVFSKSSQLHGKATGAGTLAGTITGGVPDMQAQREFQVGGGA